MSQYKFTHTTADVYGNIQSKIIHITYESNLNDLVDAFRDFVKGCGYNLDGMDIQLVDTDKEDES